MTKQGNFTPRVVSILCALTVFFSSIVQSHAEDLLPPPAEPKKDEKLEKEIDTRRSMLQWHQGLGIATMGLLTGTVVLGQLNYSDVIEGSAEETYQAPHKYLAIATGALFAATALTAYLAPVPFKKETQVDTASIHKWTMTATVVLLAAQIALGVFARDARGTSDEATLAKTHLVLGYTTYALTAAGVGVLFF